MESTETEAFSSKKVEAKENGEEAEGGEKAAGGEAEAGPSAAQRTRAERNRQRARALRAARLQPPAAAARAPARDTGGGFLVEEAAAPPPPPPPPPAPLPPDERRACLECARLLASSYLLDTFDYPVCDACRDEAGAHALVTRTEAKGEFLLKDCDLDARAPPLRCVRRANPHRGARSDMRLYLRAQVERRALQVWGSEARLEAERAARGERRGAAAARAQARRLRALRMSVRSSLFAHSRPAHAHAHAHRWAAEAHDAARDLYSRACLDCGHLETYEKM